MEHLRTTAESRELMEEEYRTILEDLRVLRSEVRVQGMGGLGVFVFRVKDFGGSGFGVSGEGFWTYVSALEQSLCSSGYLMGSGNVALGLGCN